MIKTMGLGLVLVAATSATLAQTRGEATYKAQCMPCHGATGAGDTPIGKAFQAKSLSDPEIVKASDTALFGFVKNGTGKMPPFKDKLTDDQIQDVVAYIRTLQKK